MLVVDVLYGLLVVCRCHAVRICTPLEGQHISSTPTGSLGANSSTSVAGTEAVVPGLPMMSGVRLRLVVVQRFCDVAF